ncbi:hypothetical protein MASR2M50_04820 [Thauera sp.]
MRRSYLVPRRAMPVVVSPKGIDECPRAWPSGTDKKHEEIVSKLRAVGKPPKKQRPKAAEE